MLKKNVEKEEDECKVSIALLFFNDAFIKSAVLNKKLMLQIHRSASGAIP